MLRFVHTTINQQKKKTHACARALEDSEPSRECLHFCLRSSTLKLATVLGILFQFSVFVCLTVTDSVVTAVVNKVSMIFCYTFCRQKLHFGRFYFRGRQ